MPSLRNARHEAFAQLYAIGHTATQAYRQAISCDCMNVSAAQAASRLLKNVNIRSRVSELQSQAAEILSNRIGFTKETLLCYLTEVLVTPIGLVDANHRLAQEVIETPSSIRVRMPSKIEAARQIALLSGWMKPQKSGLRPADTLSALLEDIRQPGIPKEPCARGLPAHDVKA